MVFGVLLVLWGAASVFGEFLEVRLTKVLETSDEQPPPRAAHSSVLVARELISIFVFGLLEIYASRRHTGFIHTMAGTPEPLRGSSVQLLPCVTITVFQFFCVQLCVFQCRNLLFIGFGLSADDLLRFFGSRTVERNINVLLCLQQVENHLWICFPEKQGQK